MRSNWPAGFVLDGTGTCGADVAVGTAAGTEAVNHGNAYDLPATAQTTGSAFTTDNIAIVEGVISPSADGTISIRGIAENASTITVQGASSVLTWSRIDWPAEA